MTTGEPLPCDGTLVRLMRCGLLRNSLHASGWEVDWFTSNFSHFEKTRRFRGNGIWRDEKGPIHLLSGCGYPNNFSLSRFIDHRRVASAFSRLALTMRSPEVVHCSMPTVELAAACAAFCRPRGIPLVLDIRDLWPDVFAQALPPRLRSIGQLAIFPYDHMLKKALLHADALWAVSQSYLDWGLAKIGRSARPADRVHFLGYPRPNLLAADRDRGRASLGLSKGDDTLVAWFIGSWGQSYDLRLIVETARHLSRTADRILFVVSGDGEQGAEIRQAAAGLNNIRFTGWVDRTEIASLMAAADLGLAAYIQGAVQGLTNKVIEYLAGGLPVISTLAGECMEFLASNALGWSVPAGKPADMASLLCDLAQDRAKLASHARKCRAFFDSHLDAEVVYPRMVSDLGALAETGNANRKHSRRTLEYSCNNPPAKLIVT